MVEGHRTAHYPFVNHPSSQPSDKKTAARDFFTESGDFAVDMLFLGVIIRAMLIQLEHAERLIQAAEMELGEAESRVEELRVLIRFLKRQIEKNRTQQGPELPFTDGPAPNYAKKTLPEAVADVLRRAGKPLHVREIAKRIVKGGKKDARHMTVSITSAARRRDDLFIQTAKATFSLRNGVFLNEQGPDD